MQLAGKIPDVHVQLWASALLKGKSVSTYAIPVSRLFNRHYHIIIIVTPFTGDVTLAMSMVLYLFSRVGESTAVYTFACDVILLWQ